MNVFSIKAIVFLTKLNKSAVASTPKFLESHYGTASKKQLRSLQNLVCKVARQEASIEFITTCIIYNLTPSFLRFKLYKADRQDLRKTYSFCRSLLTSELAE